MRAVRPRRLAGAATVFEGSVLSPERCLRARGGAVYPPSAESTVPVMKDAALLARKTTLGAISTGRAKRCYGASSIQ